MNAKRWERLQSLFDVAVALPPGERGSFLSRECSDDPALRLQVESLISAVDEASSFIGDAVGETARDAAAETRSGQRLGAYAIDRELGRGGMGTVFLAHRADREYEAQVAIKLLRGMYSTEHLRRFRTERQILANLQHPNIARLLDAGTAPDGTPYVVMEYVDGVPITDYCDRERLNVDQRIDLYLHVCAAVQYAHRNLVVHRDLKPGNILVTSEGIPKLLDFGIAKLLEGSMAVESETTTGLRAMTPAYASPEQVRGQSITVATDVYGLGLVLYRLLTGRLPYELRGKNLHETAQIISEAEPARPSVVVTRPKPETGDAETPIVEPSSGRLRKRLVGDLDTILLTALQKEPGRRYGSVERFSDDLRRHREGLPVTARADAFGYRAGKFVRRHRFGVATAVAAVLFLAAFGITMAVQAQRIAQERDAATIAQASAESVSDFLIDLFEVADPSESRGEQITAREILDRGSATIADELSGQPGTRASMMEVMGRVYQNIGAYEQASTMLDSALSIRRATFGDEHPDVASSLHALGALRWILGEYDEARPVLQEALELRRRLLPPYAPEQAETLDQLATVESDAGNHDIAESLYREALAIQRAIHEADHVDLATGVLNLGGALRRTGAYDSAEPLLREGLEMRRRLLGDDHLDVGHALNQLARLLVLKGDAESAEPLAREGLAIRRKNFGDVHVEVAASLGNLSGILRANGDLDEAVSVRQESLDILRSLFGDRHPYVAATLQSLAAGQLEIGALDSAEVNYRYSLDLHRELLEPDDPNLGFPLTGLARVLMAHGRHANAEPFLREAVQIRSAGLPENHWFISASELALGICLTHLGRYDEAEPLVLGSYGNLQRQFGADDERTLEARDGVLQLYESWGRPDRANEVLGNAATPDGRT